ncbi:hypothetical protein ACIGXA_09440 [Streptomyces fildesensis]|uniref:Secreted protein n=1 Tax=Streptomyces fildesensis TaxID=375757 RepID=A0ABW8C2V2_9ACTN
MPLFLVRWCFVGEWGGWWLAVGSPAVALRWLWWVGVGRWPPRRQGGQQERTACTVRQPIQGNKSFVARRE